MGTESALPDVKQEIGDRVVEAKRVIKRLADIVEDHRKAAVSLNVKQVLTNFVLSLNLRDHANGGAGLPVSGARDEIHGCA